MTKYGSSPMAGNDTPPISSTGTLPARCDRNNSAGWAFQLLTLAPARTDGSTLERVLGRRRPTGRRLGISKSPVPDNVLLQRTMDDAAQCQFRNDARRKRSPSTLRACTLCGVHQRRYGGRSPRWRTTVAVQVPLHGRDAHAIASRQVGICRPCRSHRRSEGSGGAAWRNSRACNSSAWRRSFSSRGNSRRAIPTLRHACAGRWHSATCSPALVGHHLQGGSSWLRKEDAPLAAVEGSAACGPRISATEGGLLAPAGSSRRVCGASARKWKHMALRRPSPKYSTASSEAAGWPRQERHLAGERGVDLRSRRRQTRGTRTWVLAVGAGAARTGRARRRGETVEAESQPVRHHVQRRLLDLGAAVVEVGLVNGEPVPVGTGRAPGPNSGSAARCQ